jgi:hypothetical protein
MPEQNSIVASRIEREIEKKGKTKVDNNGLFLIVWCFAIVYLK